MLVIHICNKLREVPKKWFKIYKALIVSEACIGNGSQRCVRNLRANIMSYQNLATFKFQAKGFDYGEKIREFAAALIVKLQQLNLENYSFCLGPTLPKDYKQLNSRFKNFSQCSKE